MAETTTRLLDSTDLCHSMGEHSRIKLMKKCAMRYNIMYKQEPQITIIYFGPITPQGEASKGGYAAANRKNCNFLKKSGCKVIEFSKKNNISLIFQPFEILFHKVDRNTIIHIATPLTGLFMCPVLLIELFAKIKKIPSVLDIRAGLFIRRYVQYHRVNKFLTKCILNCADLVAVESRCYKEQLKSVVGYKEEVYYFPNTVPPVSSFEPKNCEELNILYFGRLTMAKGVRMMLDIIKDLPSKYHLYLAGPLASNVEENSLHVERVSYLGVLNPSQLESLMKRMHFFLFPSYHKGEGQSNSLIEAMSQGLIPITSDNGFCEEVVGGCGNVLPMGADFSAYAKCIKDYNEDKINDYGRRCANYVFVNHNTEVEIRKIIHEYKKLLLRYV